MSVCHSPQQHSHDFIVFSTATIVIHVFERWIECNLSQMHQTVENFQPRFRNTQLSYVVKNFVSILIFHGLVQFRLFSTHFAEVNLFDFRRQFFHYLLFGSSQYERINQFTQFLCFLRVCSFFYWTNELLFEVGIATQQPWIQEIHLTPYVQQSILYGRTRQGNSTFRLQF